MISLNYRKINFSIIYSSKAHYLSINLYHVPVLLPSIFLAEKQLFQTRPQTRILWAAFAIVKLRFPWRPADLTSAVKSSKLSFHFHSWKLCMVRMEKKKQKLKMTGCIWFGPGPQKWGCPAWDWLEGSLRAWLWGLPLNPSYCTLTTAQIHKPNSSALASLESDQSPPHQEHEV